MRNAALLHDLTAELHAAVFDPERWRAAWLALNEFLGDAEQADAALLVPKEEEMAHWPERRLLSPRQRELAGLLLTFHSLDAAAEKMGITRRTVRDHLAGLFKSTGMRRQQDLINFLRRGTRP